MSTAHCGFTPLWQRVEPIIASRQSSGKLPRANHGGWHTVCSPLRSDNDPSFSVRPDSPSDPGGYYDFATGEHGSMADLAWKLGVDPRTNAASVAPVTTASLDAFAGSRALSAERLREVFGVESVRHKGRPALQYPTVIGIDRLKYTDSKKPKYEWANKGGERHWYNLNRAKALDGPIYIVNGEPSVWACDQAGVAAVCLMGGEAATPSLALAGELRKTVGERPVVVVYDLDQAGRNGAHAVVSALRDGGVSAKALLLPEALGEKGDVDDLHRLTGDGGLADALATLKELDQAELVRVEIPRRARAWPNLAHEALHGLVGEIVSEIAPHTEADPAAVLANVLVFTGSAIGRTAFAGVGPKRHYANEYFVYVGDTSKGRKGTSLDHVRALFELADPQWATDCVANGLSSGEGLIYAVRDASETLDKDGLPTDIGVPDKRLLVVEEEFSGTLRVASRDGNSVSMQLRQGWDSGNLRTMTRNNPLRATDAHISVIGHTTDVELQRNLTETEAANGFANRFCWLCVTRSRLLPDGGGSIDLERLASKLREVLQFARSLDQPLKRDEEATAMWRQVYGLLSAGRPGLLGAVTSRAEAHVLRFSLIYAVLDKSNVVTRAHLEAALALWQYCEESARYIFGDRLGDPIADGILDLLATNGDAGAAKTEISNSFGRNVSAARIQVALTSLLDAGDIREFREQTDGRPRTVYVLADTDNCGLNSSTSFHS